MCVRGAARAVRTDTLLVYVVRVALQVFADVVLRKVGLMEVVIDL